MVLLAKSMEFDLQKGHLRNVNGPLLNRKRQSNIF